MFVFQLSNHHIYITCNVTYCLYFYQLLELKLVVCSSGRLWQQKSSNTGTAMQYGAMNRHDVFH